LCRAIVVDKTEGTCGLCEEVFIFVIDERNDSSLGSKAESYELSKGSKCGVGEGLLCIEVMVRGYLIDMRMRGIRFAWCKTSRLIVPVLCKPRMYLSQHAPIVLLTCIPPVHGRSLQPALSNAAPG
jgi:hypothetical protein